MMHVLLLRISYSVDTHAERYSYDDQKDYRPV